MELLLVRHGLPVRIEDAGGPADPELSEEGWEQARRLAAWYARDPIDAIYCSPLRRARQTAEPLAEALGVEVVVDEELAEFDRDAHFYIPYEELKATKDPRFLQMLEGRWGDDGEVDPMVFREIVVTAFERLVEAHPGQRVTVVCHGGVINAYLAHVVGIDTVLFFEPHYTGVNRVLAARTGERSVLSINEVGHLEGTRS
jgi:2,3-bisphosphoglycerate-dependent phosphoglycerate mutase